MPRLGRRKQQEQQKPLPCLELCLAMWEDWWFLMDIENQASQAVNRQPKFVRKDAVVNWSRFRDFLLRVHHPPSEHNATNSLLDFSAPLEGRPKNNSAFNSNRIVEALATWCQSSRRIYRLSAELQVLLRATSLNDVRWSDVVLPFASFAIELAQPIVGANGHIYDFVLVSSYSYVDEEGTWGKRVDFRFFSTQRNGYVPLTQATREHFSALLRQENWQRMVDDWNRQFRHLGRCWGMTSINRPEGEIASLEVTGLADHFCRDVPADADPNEDARCDRATIDTLLRVVVGLVLYLKTLPGGSPHVSPPTKPFRGGLPDRKVITNRWEVCNVTSVIPLTREERVFYGIEGNQEEQRQAKHELSCHFREGHWRRPPGRGDDPTAPRTVHVRPCIVRRDRLPKDGGLPAGAAKGDPVE